ncbi:hypothetical protein RUND412_003505 [Rhizina undulata]
MKNLPAEILQEIVGLLFGDDLDSVRLVSRELSGVATEFKYRTLCVSIIYPWGYLPPVREWNSPRLSATKYGSSLDIAKVMEVARIFVKWYNKNLYTTQTKLEDSGECVAALEAAFLRMSNIRVLQPFFCQCLNSVRGAFDKWRRIQTGIKRRCIIDMEWNVVWNLALYAWQTQDSETRGTKHILDLIDVSYRVGLKPEGLAIGPSITSESPVLLSTFFADNSRVLQFCAPLFGNLTSLSLCLDGPYQLKNYTTFDGLEKTIKEGRLHKTPIASPICIWQQLHLENIHTFDLRTPDAIIDVEDLVNVLRRISGNLDTLSLDVFSLSGGTWRDHCAPLIENLTSLSLYLRGGPYKSKDYTNLESLEKAIEASRLYTFLSSALNLRFLSLRIRFCDIWDVREPPSLSLLDIFGNACVWKYLHTLHFRASHTIIDVKELVDVLRGHSATLDTLTLDVDSLSGGTCRDLLDTLKEQVHLAKFYLKFYRDTLRPYYSRVEFDQMIAYVLHQGPAFPPTEKELEDER